MIRYVVSVFVLLLPLHSRAEVNWYGGIGAGLMIVEGIKPSNIENEITGIGGVTSSYDTNNRTNYKSFSIGQCFNENFCMEGVYLWGAHFSTSLALNSVDIGIIKISGLPVVDIGVIPTNVILRREADISATQLSALWKVPVSEDIDVFGRIGFYDYSIKTTVKILLPGTSIFIAEESEDRGTVPIASIGMDANFLKKVTIRAEGQKTGVVTIFSVLFVYKIK